MDTSFFLLVRVSISYTYFDVRNCLFNFSDSSNQIGVNMVEVLLGGSPNKLGEPNALNRIKPFVSLFFKSYPIIYFQLKEAHTHTNLFVKPSNFKAYIDLSYLILWNELKWIDQKLKTSLFLTLVVVDIISIVWSVYFIFNSAFQNF